MGKYAPLYALVQQVPVGRVATYGQLAKLMGLTPRQVGYAMAALSSDDDVPWHRVINSQGKLSFRANGQPSQRQFARLQSEGIPLTSLTAKIDLQRYQWVPDWADENDEPLDIPGWG